VDKEGVKVATQKRKKTFGSHEKRPTRPFFFASRRRAPQSAPASLFAFLSIYLGVWEKLLKLLQG